MGSYTQQAAKARKAAAKCKTERGRNRALNRAAEFDALAAAEAHLAARAAAEAADPARRAAWSERLAELSSVTTVDAEAAMRAVVRSDADLAFVLGETVDPCWA